MKYIFKEKFLFVALALFLIFYLPFINSVPYLDGNIDFIKSYDFYNGGFKQLFLNWGSVHPPFKEIVNKIIFLVLGVSATSYNLSGVIYGFSGICAYYFLVKRFFGNSVSVLAVLLLSVNPLFLSTGIYSLTDFIVTNLIICSFYFYVEEKHVFTFIFLSFLVLTKETSIIFPISILFIEFTYIFIKTTSKTSAKGFLLRICSVLAPLFIMYAWFYFMKLNGKAAWSDWNFSEVANKGTVYTIYHNIFTFGFLNKYAFQNWSMLFLLNFNWVYWLFFLIGLTITIYKMSLKEIFKIKILRLFDFKALTVSILFCMGYFFTVLSFQTYTIPRYALPLIPFLLTMVSWSIINTVKYFPITKLFIYTILFIVMPLSLFSSVDPVSKNVWGSTTVMGEKLYSLNKTLSGNDGITYNEQYLLITKKRTKTIGYSENLDNYRKNLDCWWLFPDPNNDKKTFKILNLNNKMLKNCNF